MWNLVDRLLKSSQRANPSAEKLAAEKAGDNHGQKEHQKSGKELTQGKLKHKQLGSCTHRAGMQGDEIIKPIDDEGNQQNSHPDPFIKLFR